ncbi:MAG: DUF3108 domain-containing protein [Gammaproteobacteria bacterium]|nr:DUF3108 domain-containing protein [Gammaproteobacteria bacterium]MDH5734586.1 DUF3108 domain-containing protein [Gammaproteobacteria bacterium]
MKWITLLCCFLSYQSLAFETPPAFTATYLIKKYDSTIAQTTMALKKTNEHINFTSSSKAEGLAAIFTSDIITESSKLKLSENNNSPYLIEYNYIRKQKPEKNQTIKIAWNENNTANIISQYKKNHTEFNEPHPVWDNHSVQLALMSDINTAKINDTLHYRVVEKKSLTDYNFKYLGDENITLNDHNYLTKKIERIHASGKRTTLIWLATELANLPIIIEQHKDKDIHLRMILKDIKIEAN